MTEDTIERTGWLIRDKGRFYLATAFEWWRMTGVDPRALRGRGIRPESAATVVGSVGSGRTLRVHDIRAHRPGGPQRSARPAFIAEPVPHLLAASDIRLAWHRWLRGEGFVELSLPTPGAEALGPDLAHRLVLGGLHRGFRFGRGPAPTEREELAVFEGGADLRRTADLVTGLVCRAGEAAGAGIPRSAFVTWGAGTRARHHEFFDCPAGARRLVEERLRSAGASVAHIGSQGGRDRLAVWGGDPFARARILDLAAGVLARQEDIADQWCPTWVRAGCADGEEADGGLRASLDLRGHRVAECRAGFAAVDWVRLVSAVCGLRGEHDAVLEPPEGGHGR